MAPRLHFAAPNGLAQYRGPRTGGNDRVGKHIASRSARAVAARHGQRLHTRELHLHTPGHRNRAVPGPAAQRPDAPSRACERPASRRAGNAGEKHLERGSDEDVLVMPAAARELTRTRTGDFVARTPAEMPAHPRHSSSARQTHNACKPDEQAEERRRVMLAVGPQPSTPPSRTARQRPAQLSPLGTPCTRRRPFPAAEDAQQPERHSHARGLGSRSPRRRTPKRAATSQGSDAIRNGGMVRGRSDGPGTCPDERDGDPGDHED